MHSSLRFVVVFSGAVFAVVAGVVILKRSNTDGQTASQLDVAATVTEPTGTVFPQPTPIAWEGYVTRTLAGSRGLEIKSVMASGGYFFAYHEDGFPASISARPLRINGQWLGVSCEYGRCAPEVEAESWELLPIVSE
jgi:hypothetical protein